MKKGIWIAIIIFIAGMIAGLLVGRYWPNAGQNWLAMNAYNTAKNQAGQAMAKNAGLSGTVLEVKASSLTFKTHIKYNDNILAIAKEATVDGQTAIYALTPKAQNDYYSPEYTKQLSALQASLKRATVQKNSAAAKKIVDQIKALTAEASLVRNQQVRDLQQKLVSLPDGSAEKADLSFQLENLNSNYNFSKIKLADIKTGSAVQLWSNDDMSADKFKASKIEVIQ